LHAGVLPALLRENANFRRFFAGQSASLLGDQISLLALPLTAVLVLHAGATRMSLLTTIALAPNLLFALHAGSWIDRRAQRRRTMIAADVGRALLVATVPVATALGRLSFGQLLVVGFLVGTLSVFFSVAYGSLFASTVTSEWYLDGQTLLNGSRAIANLAGPSVGGALVQLLRAPYALLADSISFALSAGALARMDTREEPASSPDERSVLDGLRWIRRSPVIRPELVAVATINYFNFIFFALFLLYVSRSLHVRPATLGLVLGAGAIGGIVGSVVAGRIARRIGLGPALALGCFLFPAPIVLVPAAAGPRWVVLGCLFLAELGSGLGVMILDIAAGTIRAGLIPPGMRSRVAGAFTMVNYGVRPLGTLSAGALASLVGIHTTLWIGTVGAVAGILWLVPSPIWSLHDLPPVEEVTIA
jgi:MFS family permease